MVAELAEGNRVKRFDFLCVFFVVVWAEACAGTLNVMEAETRPFFEPLSMSLCETHILK